MKTIAKLWIGIIVIAVLTPIGLILPAYFKANAAWGEWNIEEVRALIGYIPLGLERLANLWSAPIPDYAFRSGEKSGIFAQGAGYIISAISGIALTAVMTFLLSIFLSRKGR